MRISEIFSGVQGEGRFQGTPAIFIRTSGCTRACSFCDTKYHTKATAYTPIQVAEEIMERNTSYPKRSFPVVWTGGEPLLQIEDLYVVRRILAERLQGIDHHLETNGDLIKEFVDYIRIMDKFEYVAISPKCLETAIRVSNFKKEAQHVHSDGHSDIKVVTDLSTVGVEMIPYATSLMPYTTYNKKDDDFIRKRVTEFCVSHNLFYSARLHVITYGKKRGV